MHRGRSAGPSRRDAPPRATTFQSALTDAIAARGVTLDWLRRRLSDRGSPVSLATLSYWRSGRSRPEHPASLDALAELEDLLGLAPSALSSLLGPSRRIAPGARPAPLADVVDERVDLVQEALAALDLAGPPQLADETVHVTVDVDATGCTRRIATRSTLRVLVDGAQRLPLILVADTITRAPDIVTHGGRLGRDRSRPELGLVAREFMFPEPMRAGERVAAETVTTFRDDQPDPCYEHYSVAKVSELLIWVRFDPARLPARLESVATIDEVEVDERLDLGPTASVQVVHRPFGPGRLGIRWAW